MNRVLVFALVAAAACDTDVSRTNAYDPRTPASQRLPGRFLGQVELEDGADPTGVEVRLTEAAGVTALSHTALADDTGRFAIEVTSGTYNLEVRHPGYLRHTRADLDVAPGTARDLGLVSLARGRGSVVGRVLLNDGGSPTGAAVSLVPCDDVERAATTVLVGPDGRYMATSVPEGRYQVRAAKAEYAPAYTDDNVLVAAETLTRDVSTPVPDLRLYPASAIVQLEVGGVVNAPYTNDREVNVLLLAFVNLLTEMRVSADPGFADPAWDTAYRQFNASASLTLADADGTHTVHAQFMDRLGIASEVFSSSIVLDRAEPRIDRLTINGGAAFLTLADGAGAATLEIIGYDALSGVSAYRYTTQAGFSDEPWHPVDAIGSTISLLVPASLGDEQGLKQVRVALRDRAGNVSPVATAAIMRDTVPPATGDPVIALAPGSLTATGAARSLDVELHLAVAGDRPDEPLFMAISNAPGLDGNAPFVPFASPVAHTLALGTDSMERQVCAIFRDAAGLLTQASCLPVSVDRSGGLSGRVELEGRADHGGVLVEVSHQLAPDAVFGDVTGADGSYTILGIPGGSGYAIRFHMQGFVEAREQDVVVVTGAVVDRGVRVLGLPRASLRGSVTLVDADPTGNGGIVITDASGTFVTLTSPSGSFSLAELPVDRSYLLTASFPGYLPRAYAEQQGLLAGEVRDLGALPPLQRQLGDFRVCAETDLSCAQPLLFTASRRVLLGLANQTLTSWRASLLPDFADASFAPFVASEPHFFDFDAAAPDGRKTIYVEMSDGGAASTVLSGEVTLDTEPPLIAGDAIVIDADADGTGAIYSNHPTGRVRLSLAASDAHAGVATVRLQQRLPGEAPELDAVLPVAFLPTLLFDLDAAVQGEQVVFVQFCDLVGNCTPVATPPEETLHDSVIYDSLAPSPTTGTGIAMEGGANLTSTPFVTLEVAAGDAVAFRAGNSANLSAAAWVPLQPGELLSYPHLLPLGEQTHTIYAQFIDAAGNASPLSPNPFTCAVTLDTTPPIGAALTLLEGTYTNADSITARMQASGASAYIVHVGTTESFAGESWQQLTAPPADWQHELGVALPAPATDGLWTVYARYADAAGNVTPTLSASIRRDTVHPLLVSAGVVEGEATGATALTSVTLRVEAVGADELELTGDLVDAWAGAGAWVPATSFLFVHLAPTSDGQRSISVAARDFAGNPGTPAAVTATVLLDREAPVPATLQLAGGAAYTASRSVWLDVSASDATSGVREVAFGDGSALDCNTARYEPFAPRRSWLLPDAQGPVWVSACVRDAAGNTSFASDDIHLDLLPPSGTLTLAAQGGTEPTRFTLVDLHLTRSADVTEVAFANGAIDCSSAAYEAYPVADIKAGWSVPAGSGTKLVSVCFKDAAGNTAAVSDTIEVDQTPPVGTLAIGGSSPTRLRYVDLALSASPDVTQMRVANQPLDTLDCSAGGFVPYAWSVASHDLGATPGTIEVSVCFADAAGNTGKASDTVVLDTSAPSGSLAILDGSPTRVTGISVQLVTDADAYALANGTASCEAVPYTLVTASPVTVPWTLPGGDGSKTVVACFRDEAGNTSADAATVLLDQTAPTLLSLEVRGALVRMAGGQLFARGSPVTVAMTGYDVNGLDAIMLANDTAFTDGEGGTLPVWEGWPGTGERSDWDFVAGADGPRAVHLRLRDTAGNVTTAQAPFTLDTAPPAAGTVVLADGVATVTSRLLPISIRDTQPASMAFWEDTGVGCGDPACDDARFVPFAPSTTLTLSDETGVKQLCWRFCDLAGNGTMPVGTAAVTLSTYVPRPRPELASVAPLSYVALSREYLASPPSPLYPLTLAGRGIAYDSVAVVGDFTLPCLSSDPEQDCRADAGGGCGTGGACEATCDTACTVALPPGLVRNPGTYVVRLATPAPVENDAGTSLETKTFSMLGPLPSITRLSPRGVTQQVDTAGAPVAQSLTVGVWGTRFTDNVQFRLAGNFGQVVRLEDDPPGTENRYAEVIISTAGLLPRHEDDCDFAAINPSPGGGEHVVGFGLNPVVHACPDLGACASSLRPTRTRLVSNEGVYQRYAAGAVPWFGGLSWQGGTHGATRNDSIALLSRVPAHSAGDVVPLPLGYDSVELQSVRGDAPAASLAAPVSGRGSGAFAAVTTVATGSRPGALRLADLDADGTLDLAVANYDSYDVTIHLGDGLGGFGAGTSYPMGFNLESLALGDLNGDGALDLVAGTYNIGTYAGAVRLGNGDGTFGPRAALPALQTQTYAIQIADVDADGAADLVLGTTTRMSTLLGRGDGRFYTPITYPMNGTPNYGLADLALGDVDGDGLLDAVGANSQSGSFSWRPGRGDGTFGAMTEVAVGGTPNRIGNVELVDLDLDGMLDVVLADATRNLILVVLARGQGTFAAAASYAMPGAPGDLTVADLDGDGLADIAAVTTSSVTWRPGQGDGTLGDAQALAMDGWLGGLAIGDLDRDGAPDLVASRYSDDLAAVRRGVPGASLGRRVDPTLGVALADVTVGDLDRDGNPDLWGSYGNSARVRRGDGTGDFAASASHALGSSARALRLGDLDGDGNGDLVASMNFDDVVAVALQQADGSFAGAVTYAMGDGPGPLAVGDLDRDGHLDLVAAHSAAPLLDTRGVMVRLGVGDGTFAAESAVPIGVSHSSITFRAIALGDINADGILDLLVGLGNSYAPAIAVFLGAGDGTFVRQSDLSTSSSQNQTVGLVVADVDHDGLGDLLAAHSTVARVYRSLGNGAFAAGASYPMGNSYSVAGLAAADINGDGHVDMTTADAAGHSVSLRLGFGDATFGPRIALDTGFTVGSVDKAVLRDLDRDGVVDIGLAVSSAGLPAAFLLPAPTGWTQELSDMPAASVALPPGVSQQSVHQAAQDVTSLAVRVRIYDPTATLESLSLTLRSPRPGDPDLLLDAAGCGADWSGQTLLRAAYPTTTLCAGTSLASAQGWQPEGDWTLIVDNQGTATAELQDFTVVTYGYLQTPPLGSGLTAPEPIVIPAGKSGAVVPGTTLGFPDLASLSCAASQGDLDGDGVLDVGDHWYELTLAEAKSVTLQVVAAFDAALELRQGACAGGTLVACDDNGLVTGKRNPKLVRALAAGTYCIIVDGAAFDAGTPADPTDDQVHVGDYDLFVALQ